MNATSLIILVFVNSCSVLFLYFVYFQQAITCSRIRIEMCAFQLILSVDPSLGRVDYSLLSDQTLMEMLIEGFDEQTKKKYQDDDGMHLDVCQWWCIKCDVDGRVIQVKISSDFASGSLALRYVPPKVKFLRIKSWGSSKITGSVEFARLPDGMESLSLEYNQLTGSVDLTRVPRGMNFLRLNTNRLTGKIDLTRLPAPMVQVYLYDNQLTGEIDLTHLPDGMEFLCLKGNQLTGKIHLTQLPDGMEYVSLCKNQFTGEIDLRRLPPGMQRLYISENQLTGEIDLTQLPNDMKRLVVNNNQLTGSVDLTKLPWKMGHLLLNNNRLSGSFVITRVPTWMEVIHAGGNRFNAIAVVDSEARASIRLRGSGVTSVVDANGREMEMGRFMD